MDGSTTRRTTIRAWIYPSPNPNAPRKKHVVSLESSLRPIDRF